MVCLCLFGFICVVCVFYRCLSLFFFFFFQAEDGIRDHCVTGVQTCALPILWKIKASSGNDASPQQTSSLLAIPFWCSYTVLKTKSRGKPSPTREDESHESLLHTAGKTALTICGFHLGL